MSSFNFYLRHKEKISLYTGQICYAPLTYHKVPLTVQSIVLYHSTKEISYKEDEVKRWIETINSIGFPVEYKGIKSMIIGSYEANVSAKENEQGLVGGYTPSYVFELDLKNYEKKIKLTSALTLVRYLIESGSNSIPSYFFNLEKIKSKFDKCELIQLTHSMFGPGCYLPTNHMLRNNIPTMLVSTEEVHNRIEENPVSVRESCTQGMYVHETWKGAPIPSYKIEQEIKSCAITKDYKKVIEIYSSLK